MFISEAIWSWPIFIACLNECLVLFFFNFSTIDVWVIVMSSRIPISEIIIPPNKIPLKSKFDVSPSIKNLASSDDNPVKLVSLENAIVKMPAMARVMRLEIDAR